MQLCQLIALINKTKTGTNFFQGVDSNRGHTICGDKDSVAYVPLSLLQLYGVDL